jgi:hypothetical protein
MHVLITIAAFIVFSIATSPFIKPYYPAGKDWIDFLSALSAPILGLVAIWVAYRQMQIDAKIHRQGDRSNYLDIFRRIAGAIIVIKRTMEVSDQLNVLYGIYADAELLLDKEAGDEILVIIEKIEEINKIKKQISIFPPETNINSLKKQHKDYVDKLNILELLASFKRHLNS